MTKHRSLAKLLPFPLFRQSTPNDCGVTATQMILAWAGIDVRADRLREEVGQTEELGTPPQGIMQALDNHAIKYHQGTMSKTHLKQAIDRGHPVLLVLQAWPEEVPIDWSAFSDHGHYAIAIGYDQNGVIFADPSSIHRTFLGFEELEQRWHDVGDAGEEYDHFGIEIIAPPDRQYDPHHTIPMG